MAGERGASLGTDNILRAYDAMADGVPYYSVWCNQKEKYIQWNKDDQDRGRQFLEDNLLALEASGDSALYYLRIHPTSETVYKGSSDMLCSLPIRLNENQNRQVSGMSGFSGMPLDMYQVISGLKDLPEKISMQYNALSERMDALENPEVDSPGNALLGQISGLLNNEHIAPVIGKMLEGLIGKIMPQPASYTVPYSNLNTASISGLNDTQAAETKTVSNEDVDLIYWNRVNDALIRLQPHCDLPNALEKLAAMADSKPDFFKMLLSNLQ